MAALSDGGGSGGGGGGGDMATNLKAGPAARPLWALSPVGVLLVFLLAIPLWTVPRRPPSWQRRLWRSVGWLRRWRRVRRRRPRRRRGAPLPGSPAGGPAIATPRLRRVVVAAPPQPRSWVDGLRRARWPASHAAWCGGGRPAVGLGGGQRCAGRAGWVPRSLRAPPPRPLVGGDEVTARFESSGVLGVEPPPAGGHGGGGGIGGCGRGGGRRRRRR